MCFSLSGSVFVLLVYCFSCVTIGTLDQHTSLLMSIVCIVGFGRDCLAVLLSLFVATDIPVGIVIIVGKITLQIAAIRFSPAGKFFR